MVSAKILAEQEGFSSLKAYYQHLVQIGFFKPSPQSYVGYVPIPAIGQLRVVKFIYKKGWQVLFTKKAIQIINDLKKGQNRIAI